MRAHGYRCTIHRGRFCTCDNDSAFEETRLYGVDVEQAELDDADAMAGW